MLLHLPRYKNIELISHSIDGCISLSQGAVKIGGTPQLIKEHIREILQSEVVDFYQYVGGILPLRQKIAKRISEIKGCCCETENIMITHGAIGGITAICLALLQSGDEVILPEPAYPSYRNIILFSKAHPIYVESYLREKNNWYFDLDAIKKKTTEKTKMIIISHPSNPTGMILQKESMIALREWCENKGIYLISDEVYDNYIYEGKFHSFTTDVLDSGLIMRTGSFSKDFAMSGWRIGFIVAPKSLITKFIAVQDGTLCCPSVVGQHAALFALEHEELIAEQVNVVKRNRDLSCELLKPLVDRGIFSFTKPQAGIFLFIKTGKPDSEPLVMDLLHKAHVALVPGKDFGNSEEAYASLRLCFARKEEVLREGLNRLLHYFGECISSHEPNAVTAHALKKAGKKKVKFLNR